VEEAIQRASTRLSKVTVSGRYHRHPRCIQDDYTVEETVLGVGCNGPVYRARCLQTGRAFSVKALRLRGIPPLKMRDLVAEAEIFLSMDHPHVARLVDVYECPEKLTLVSECMEGGELFERVLMLRKFSEPDAAQTMLQILLAVNYIHSHNVVHRDLKLEHFLYHQVGSEHLKLIDFGFSHVCTPGTTMVTECGTLDYVAPEVLGRSYTSKCDIWSVGVICFILIAGYMPFGGSGGDRESQMHQIKAGKWANRPAEWKGVSAVARDFISRLLTVNPARRPSAAEALQHAFVSDINMRKCSSAELDKGVIDALQSFSRASRFRRCCLSLMAWYLTDEEREKVHDAFIAMDLDRRGAITLSELKEAMADYFDFTDEQIKRIFDALDIGTNGEITYSDFLAAMVSMRIPMHYDMLNATFRRFDTDNSGYITPANLREVLGESFDGADVKQLIQEADFVGDGQISFDEFLQFLNFSVSEANAQSDVVGPFSRLASRVLKVIGSLLPCSCVDVAENGRKQIGMIQKHSVRTRSPLQIDPALASVAA